MELNYLLIRLGNQELTGFFFFEEERVNLSKLLKSRVRGCRIFLTGTMAGHKFDRLRKRVNTWVITHKDIHSPSIAELICTAHLKGIRVIALDSFLSKVDPSVPANSNQLIHQLANLGTEQTPWIRAYSAIKYTFEPYLALLILTLLSPLLIIVAIFVKCTSKGPALYSQERVGLRGRIFKIYKFRSMTEQAEPNGPVWASSQTGDPRLTSIGALLRSTHLDELPQLFNIIRGDISFIGPRPERPAFTAQLTTAFPLFSLRTLIKPGVTGWAQINQGYANSESDSQRKLEFDLFYLIKHSPTLDLRILVGTVALILMGGTESLHRERVTQLTGEAAVQKPSLSKAGLAIRKAS